jgi:hypothetical protein
MIETPVGIANAYEIASTPGVDVVLIGNFECAAPAFRVASLSLPPPAARRLGSRLPLSPALAPRAPTVTPLTPSPCRAHSLQVFSGTMAGTPEFTAMLESACAGALPQSSLGPGGYNIISVVETIIMIESKRRPPSPARTLISSHP